jgi:DNA ligase (NAD+)
MSLNTIEIGIGAEIEVIRSGEVIPKLENIITESDEIIIPEKCLQKTQGYLQ